jgi:hypothetical protein
LPLKLVWQESTYPISGDDDTLPSPNGIAAGFIGSMDAGMSRPVAVSDVGLDTPGVGDLWMDVKAAEAPSKKITIAGPNMASARCFTDRTRRPLPPC